MMPTFSLGLFPDHKGSLCMLKIPFRVNWRFIQEKNAFDGNEHRFTYLFKNYLEIWDAVDNLQHLSLAYTKLEMDVDHSCVSHGIQRKNTCSSTSACICIILKML